MKNIFKTALASLILFASCSTNDELATPTPTSNTLYAAIEAPQSRTYADENGKLLWTADDRITAFMGNTYPRQYQYTGETGQNYGAFEDLTPQNSVISGNNLDCNYAIYLYDGNTTISNAGVISFTIPATQSYAENSFGLGANVMVAVTKDKNDNFLSFKNLGGYFEFSLYGEGTTVKSIEFKGNNNEDLAGAAAITATYNGTPTFEFVGETSKTLTLDCGAGVELGTEANPTKFWFVVPAITYEDGITITITDTEGGVMEKSTSKSITIDRSTLQPMNAFEVEGREVVVEYCVDTPGTLATLIGNENKNTLTSVKISGYLNATDICYLREMSGSNFGGGATEGSLISLDISDAYIVEEEGVTYLWTQIGGGQYSFNTQNNVIGSYMFFRTKLEKIILPSNVTSISDRAFFCCEYLKEIVLPNNLKTIGIEAFDGCSSIANINIPNGVTSIAQRAFGGCCSLIGITIPSSAISIDKSILYGCNSLTSVIVEQGNAVYDSRNNSNAIIETATNKLIAGCNYTVIPNTVKIIGNSSLEACTTMTSIVIPSSVTTIEEYAFAQCYSLKRVDVKAINPPTLGLNAFPISGELKIYVPSASIDDYKLTDNWKVYNLLTDN